MHFSSIVAASLALASSTVAAPHSNKGKDKPTSLYKAFRESGRSYIGTAWTMRANETAEPKIIKQDFNSITPENAQKWESTEPSRNNFTFEDSDRYVEYAKKHSLQIRCHNLVWHSQLPAWVTDGKFDNHTLISIMENHIKNLAGRYRKDCTQWDVVNEALNEDGTYRESVWYTTIGEAYLPIAFKLAAKYSKAKLFYNDYNIESNNAKTAGAARIVKLIKSYGVRIDGVGYQAHLASETTPTSGGPLPSQKVLEAALHATADLGVDVAYTEIDIRMNTPATPAKLAVQAEAYKTVAKSCLAVKRCIGMTVWGISDKYSWIPGVFAGEGAALLFDEDYNKKPAYYGFLAGLKK
ncbi:endo-1,4-beta-xylanase-like protein [Lophiotrema nucula]|uniref:Beta-xylanase n=1 Tax=Lophiotrema nucula TaxID=690887 RepID=A0A6A5YMI4_9PLEO|nr:endo-1,4-beta-xylanase-like protein [Lophiotrema nucula]